MLRRFLSDRGHRPFMSNGAWYADLRIAGEGETVVDPGPLRPIRAEYLGDLAARIDAMADSLERLRALVSDAIEHADPAPHDLADRLGGIDGQH